MRAKVLLLLLACFSTSCATYRNIEISSAPTIIKPNDSVRVTTVAGEEHEFRVEAIDLEAISSSERTYPYLGLVMVERSEFDVMRSLFVYLLAGVPLLIMNYQ
jgi:hypothetical protein